MGSPTETALNSFTSLTSLYYIMLDHIWMLISSSYVRMAIYFNSIPILNEVLNRLTFMSGHSDVNANLCLCLRILYTCLPNEQLRFDPAEFEIGYSFLQIQFKVLIWLVMHCGLRILPPPLRPLYVSYYGRAMEATRFVKDAITQNDVQQIVVLGAGFDTTAYRTRSMRIRNAEKASETITPDVEMPGLGDARSPSPTKSRLVSVFEVDLPHVQRSKLEVLRRSFSEEQLSYMTEGVHFLECNFGVDSLCDALVNGGFDVNLSTAFLWEGVTYYLSKSAVDATLAQIRSLALMCPIEKCPSAQVSSLECDGNDTVASPVTDIDISRSRKRVYLMMDYMDESNTLRHTHSSWLWNLEQRLSSTLGTPFMTGFENVEQTLAKHDFMMLSQIAREDSEAQLRKMLDYTSVLFENNSTAGHREPNLAVVTAIFDPKGSKAL